MYDILSAKFLPTKFDVKIEICVVKSLMNCINGSLYIISHSTDTIPIDIRLYVKADCTRHHEGDFIDDTKTVHWVFISFTTSAYSRRFIGKYRFLV